MNKLFILLYITYVYNIICFRIQHYANQSDIQMAGMLSCAFSYRSENSDISQTRLSSKSINVSVSMLHSYVSVEF